MEKKKWSTVFPGITTNVFGKHQLLSDTKSKYPQSLVLVDSKKWNRIHSKLFKESENVRMTAK